MPPISRRAALAAIAGSAVALPHATHLVAAPATSRPGRLRQSVCRWCYADLPLDELCRNAKAIGLKSVELLSESEWSVPAKYGLTCAMANGPSTIPVGFNRPNEHDRLVAESERLLPLVAAARLPNMIVFSGNRGGMGDEEGLENCVRGLGRIIPTAERLGVTVCMELLNSKVDHKDYMCDHTAWGVELAQRVGSPRFKLLYDIYHMQIMEGDVIRTIRDNAPFLGPLPHRRRSRPPRDRRHSGAQLPRGDAGHRRDRLQRVRGAGVHPDPRPDDVAPPGGRGVYGLTVDRSGERVRRVGWPAGPRGWPRTGRPRGVGETR